MIEDAAHMSDSNVTGGTNPGVVLTGSAATLLHAAELLERCCADLRIANQYGERGRSLYCLQDVAASIQNLMLVAYSLGLGTAWVGAFDEKGVSRILNLPAHLRPVAIVPVGYPEEKPPRPGRVPREDAITHLR